MKFKVGDIYKLEWGLVHGYALCICTSVDEKNKRARGIILTDTDDRDFSRWPTGQLHIFVNSDPWTKVA